MHRRSAPRGRRLRLGGRTALGIWNGIGAIGGTLGLLLGGVLTDTAGWRWLFFVDIPVGLVVIVAARRFVAESAVGVRSFDLSGAAAVTGALVLSTRLTPAGRRRGRCSCSPARSGWGRPSSRSRPARSSRCCRSRSSLAEIRANRQPGFAAYRRDDDGVHRPYGLMVLTIARDRIATITGFPDTRLFRLFGLPPMLSSG